MSKDFRGASGTGTVVRTKRDIWRSSYINTRIVLIYDPRVRSLNTRLLIVHHPHGACTTFVSVSHHHQCSNITWRYPDKHIRRSASITEQPLYMRRNRERSVPRGDKVEVRLPTRWYTDHVRRAEIERRETWVALFGQYNVMRRGRQNNALPLFTLFTTSSPSWPRLLAVCWAVSRKDGTINVDYIRCIFESSCTGRNRNIPMTNI